MNKATRIIFTVLLMTAVALTMLACSDTDINYADIESIAVDETSVSESFLLSEFDISKVILNIKYKDTVDASGNTIAGETVQLPAAMSMVKAEDKAKLSVAGTKVITLIYGKFEVQFTISLYESAQPAYKVTFLDSDGRQLGDAQTIYDGERPVQPALPSRPGYTFIGWLDRDTNLMSSLDNITKNTYLVAVYAADTYSVSFFTRINAEESEIATVDVPRGQNAYDYAPEIPIIAGYSNGRWENIDAMKNVNAEGLKFYAIYDADQVAIGFNYKRFSAISQTITEAYDVGSDILNPPSAEYTGFKFVEWRVNGKRVEFPYRVTVETVFEAYYIEISVGNSGLGYTKTAGGLTISSYDGKEDVVVIPEQIKLNGGEVLNVVDINEGVFRNHNIKEFVVSDANAYFITEDGVLFNKDKTALIAYPKGKTLSTYNLLPTVTEIYSYAFYDAENLTEIILTDNLISIGDYAFSECIGLNNFTVTKGVVSIGKGAFTVTEGESAIASVEFANATVLTDIGDSAFSGLNNLNSIDLPSTLINLGAGVFAGCKSLSSVTAINNNNFAVVNGMLYSADRTKLYLYPAVFTQTNNPQIAINENCQNIVAGAFSHAKISGITINSTVTLDDNAIDCPNLVNFLILADDITISSQSFGSNIPLNIYIQAGNDKYADMVSMFGDRVKVYDEEAWSNSRDYLDDYIYETYTYIENIGGGNVQNTGVRILGTRLTGSTLRLPNMLNNYAVTEIAANAFAYDNFVTQIYLPANLKTIGEKAFYGMSKLEYVMFNSVVTKIGDRAFEYCKLLTTVECPVDLTGIDSFGESVFSNTPFMNSTDEEFLTVGNVLLKYNGFDTVVTVPAEIGYIATDAFKNRGEITAIRFDGNNLKIIDRYAFQYCSGLKEITFPSALVRVMSYAFDNCANLKLITYNVIKDNSTLRVEDGAYPDGVTEVFVDTTPFNLVYNVMIDNETYTARGITFVEPYLVEDTARIRFAGWYEDNAYNTLCTFPMTLTEDKQVFAKWIDINASSEGLVYSLTEDGTYAVSDYIGDDGYVIIPSRYKNGQVREIKPEAFKDKTFIKNIVLPSETNFDGSVSSLLTAIGNDAFEGTYWYDSFYGDFVIIDDFLIKYKGSSKIVYLPEHITKIAQGAFMNNTYIEKVYLPEGLTILDDNIFSGCTALQEVVLPSSLLQIGYGVFKGCEKLSNLNFEVSLNLSSVGHDAFDGTLWLNSYVDNCVMINNILYKYQGTATTLHIYNGVTMIGERAFADNTGLKFVYIPESVVSIGISSFENSAVSEVYLYAGGSRVTTIRERAFFNCTSLSLINLSLAAGLAYLGESCFEGCSSLESVSIPASLDAMGEAAFRNSGLRRVTFSGGSKLAEISPYTFAGCAALFSVSFNGTSDLTSIAEYAFYGCKALRDFDNALAAISRLGEYSFYGCESLRNLNISEMHLMEIGDRALDGVGAYQQSGSNMVVLGNILVKYNGYDSQVSIPSNITTIYNGAFQGNTRIQKIIFAEDSSILNINSDAFSGCSELSEINFPDTIRYVGDNVVTGTPWLNNQIRDGVEFIIISNTLIKYNSSELQQVIIPDVVEIINSNAFNGSSLYDIVIGDNIQRIADGAFDGIVKDRYPDWTITINTATPPILEEDSLIDANRILMPSAEVLDSYRLDEGWSIQYELMSVAGKYLVTFHTDDEKAIAVPSVEAYALYSEVEVETITQGETRYIFVGWYADEACVDSPISYPFMLKEDTILYAKCIDNQEGSNPDQYTILNDNIISLYNGSGDNKLVIISKRASIYIKEIGSGWVIDPNGNYIKDGDEYIEVQHDTEAERWSPKGAYEGHTELTEVYFAVDSQIEVIGANAFKDCTNLTRIVLPSSLKRIEKGAFEGCTSLREVVFDGASTTVSIKTGAFKDCISLTSITIPAGVISIGDKAFEGCINLSDIYMESSTAVILEELSRPFEIIAGMRIHIPFNSYNSYSSVWAIYADYLVEAAAPVEE